MQSDNTAMTEVSLALAMAFFAIFILAAVSLSQPSAQAAISCPEVSATSPASVNIHSVGLEAVPDASKDTSGERSFGKTDIFVVYFKGEFYDQELRPYLPAQQLSANQHHVVGVLPDLSIAEYLELKHAQHISSLDITLLDQAWQARLERM